MRRAVPLLSVCLLALTACEPPPVRRTAPTAALMEVPEALEFEPLAVRQELYRGVMRAAAQEAGQVVSPTGAALFPVSRGGTLVAAPAMEGVDLFLSPDAGAGVLLSFEPRGTERWSDERTESLQGLSEREAAELVARTLLARWGVRPSGPVRVDRALGAPYAAAYVDGVLRINPAFVSLAAAASAPAQ